MQKRLVFDEEIQPFAVENNADLSIGKEIEENIQLSRQRSIGQEDISEIVNIRAVFSGGGNPCNLGSRMPSAITGFDRALLRDDRTRQKSDANDDIHVLILHQPVVVLGSDLGRPIRAQNFVFQNLEMIF